MEPTAWKSISNPQKKKKIYSFNRLKEKHQKWFRNGLSQFFEASTISRLNMHHLISRISGASINPCRHFAPKLGGACIHLTNVTFSFPRKLARLIVISRPALITPRSGMINGKRSDSSGLGRRSKTINNRFTKTNNGIISQTDEPDTPLIKVSQPV